MTGYQVVPVAGGALQATAGDALKLKVVQKMSDGSTEELPAEATIAWNSPGVAKAVDPAHAQGAENPLPSRGAQPAAAWIENSSRTDVKAGLTGVLFVLDPGTAAQPTLNVTATVSGVKPGGQVTASIPVAATPTGDAARGQVLYGAQGLNCARCHGATGHGSPADDSGTKYVYNGTTYDYPAPGLNDEDGNVAGDEDWSPALLAMAARADLDDSGVALRSPMPSYVDAINPATNKQLSAQDFADIYAYLKTQTH